MAVVKGVIMRKKTGRRVSRKYDERDELGRESMSFKRMSSKEDDVSMIEDGR